MNFGERLPMLKIDKTTNGEETLKISGRMDRENVADVKMSLDSEPAGRRIVLDLQDLTLVDQDAVAFLADRETEGIKITNCPAYIREWITRERKGK
jgi:ABC-type transporter Mla MlaB component